MGCFYLVYDRIAAAADRGRGVSEWSPAQDRLLAAVSEHEVMHEGQIIRHMVGMGLELPVSWKWA